MKCVLVFKAIDSEKRCECSFLVTGACQNAQANFFSYLFVIDIVCGSYFGVEGSTR